MHTERSHKTLRQKCAYDASQQKWLDPHVQQTRDSPHRIVGMQSGKHHMPSHRGADGNFGRLEVSNLSHHDDVGILTQNSAQPVGEGQIDFRLHVDLRHTRKPIFHRLFDGDNSADHRVDRGQKRIQGRRFSRTRGTRHHDNPVRQNQKRLSNTQLLRCHVETIQSKLQRLTPAQETQGNALPVHCRDSRDTHINRTSRSLQINTPILRQTAFCDVHVRHHFKTRNNCALQAA